MSIDFTAATGANVGTITGTEGMILANDQADRAARIRWAANVLEVAQVDPRRQKITAIKTVRDKTGGFLGLADAKALVEVIARLMGPFEPLGLFVIERRGPIWPGNVAKAMVAARTAVEAENLAWALEGEDTERRWFRTSSTTKRIGIATDATKPEVLVAEVAR